MILARDDQLILAAVTHEKVGHTNQGLWHHKNMQLPAYIQHIANDLISEKGMDPSRAIATAISRCKVWCAGGDGVKPDTKAKACAAVAEWEKLKGQAGSTKAAFGTSFSARVAWNSSKHPRKAHGPGGGQFTHGPGGGGGKAPRAPGGGGAGRLTAPSGGGGWEEDFTQSSAGKWTPDMAPATGVKALTSKGRVRGTGTADDPIDVRGNLDKALTLMRDGKHVRLNQVDEVSLILHKVNDVVSKAKAAGEKPPDWDLGLLTLKGTNLFTAQHKGIPRINMPQFSGMASPDTPAAKLAGGGGKFVDLTPQLGEKLKAEGIKVTPERVKAAHLRATQTELVGSKVAGFAAAVEAGNAKAKSALQEPIYVTRDGYVVDGHHRWAANMMLDSLDGVLGNDTYQNVLKVDMDIGAMIPYSNKFAQDMGIASRGGVTKAALAALRADAELRLATLPNVELVAAGTWKLSSGRQTFTRRDIEDAVDAAACPAVGTPVIKIGHLDKRFTPNDGEPALGRVVNMRADKSGMKLLGDLAGMPGWLATISASAFPRRSIEGSYNFTCQVGHSHPFVITALALLGITAPGVGVLSDLGDVAKLYGVEAATGETERFWQVTYEEGEAIVPVTEEDVRRAYYAGADIPQTWWITELQMNPAQLVVADADGNIYQVPFQIEGEDAINFGEAVALESYGELAASRGSGRAVVFATAAESRDVTAEEDEHDYSDEDPHGGLDESWDADLADLPDLADLAVADFEAADTGMQVSAANQELDAELEAAAAKLGTGDRFKKLKDALSKKGVKNPGALAAYIGRKKFGKGKFAQLADKAKSAAAYAAADHGSCSTTHSHPHPAYGAQAGDMTHAHQHTHKGDAVHQHAHASQAGAGTMEGASKVDFTDEQNAALRASLGLEDDQELTPEGIVEGFSKRVTATARRVGGGASVEIDKGEWDAINARVKAAEDYQARQKVKERDVVIAAAVRDGKFSASRKPHYVRAWDADPEGARELIASLQKNVVPVADIGSPGGTDDELLEDEYKSLFPPGAVRS